MKLDDSKLRDAFKAIHHGSLTPAEAAAIIDVARYAASVDGRMDMSEMATVARLSKLVYALSGEPDAPVPSTPMAPGWLGEIRNKLGGPGARELAFACAHLIILVDKKVTKEETELTTKLTEALGIASPRAQELTKLVDSLVA